MTLQLFRDDSFGLCPRGFLMQFSSMMAAQAALHSAKHLPLKGLTAKKPAAPQRFGRLRVRFLKAPSFHPLLELLPPGRRIFLDSVLPQEPVHPNPKRPMLRRGDIRAQTAPGLSQQPLLRFEQVSAHRVQVNVITSGFQIPVAAALDQLGFVAPAQDMAD